MAAQAGWLVWTRIPYPRTHEPSVVVFSKPCPPAPFNVWQSSAIQVVKYSPNQMNNCGRRSPGDFIVAQAQFVSTLRGLAHLFCQCDQFLDDGGGLDDAVLIFADGGFEQFSERAGLNEKPARTKLDFVVEQFAQCFDSEIFVRHPAHLGQEFVRQNRNIGFLKTCALPPA
jgi:hypothetical protein